MKTNSTKLTPERSERILTALRDGNTITTASIYGGISIQTLDRWLERGRKTGQPIFVQFVKDFEKARIEAEIQSVERIRKAGQGGQLIKRVTKSIVNKYGRETTTTEETYTQPEWTADAWYLERRLPEQWGRKDKLTLEIADALQKQRGQVEQLFATLDKILTLEQKDRLADLWYIVRDPVKLLIDGS